MPRSPSRRGRESAGATIRAMLLEVPIYAILVVGYFFLVLHYLGGWLGREHKEHALLYAITAVGLIIGQAIVLEWVTTLLLRLMQGGRSE